MSTINWLRFMRSYQHHRSSEKCVHRSHQSYLGTALTALSAFLLLGQSALSANLATFNGVDEIARGNHYQQGFGLGGSYLAPQSPPSGGDPISNGLIKITDATVYTWELNNTKDPSVLGTTGAPRTAACWQSLTSFTIDIALNQGINQTVAIYCLDYDNPTPNRIQTIQAFDGDTNQPLQDEAGLPAQPKLVSSFWYGKYYKWTISGRVKFKIVNAGGFNAVASGIFFGNQQRPTVTLVPSWNGSVVSFPATAGQAFNGRTISKIEYFDGPAPTFSPDKKVSSFTKIGEILNPTAGTPPFSTSLASGVHSFWAKVTDNWGFSTDSATVSFLVPDIQSASSSYSPANPFPSTGQYPPRLYPPQKTDQRLRTSDETTPPTSNKGFDSPYATFTSPSPLVVNVDAYGAIPDGETDCTPAFYQALNVANYYANGLPVEIVFTKKGRYKFKKAAASNNECIIAISSRPYLTIRGQGSDTVLMMADSNLGAFYINNCDWVRLMDFAIDYCPLPFTQGKVVAKFDAPVTTPPGHSWYDVDVSPGYSWPKDVEDRIMAGSNNTDWASAYGMLTSRGYSWPTLDYLNLLAWPPAQGGNTICRFTTASTITADQKLIENNLILRSIQVGFPNLYVARRVGNSAIGMLFSRYVYIKNVTVHASPSAGCYLFECRGINIDGYACAVPAGSDRLLSANADGLSITGVRDGVTIKNCYFNNVGDDCINIRQGYGFFPGNGTGTGNENLTINNGNNLTFNWNADFKVGDTIEIVDHTTGRRKQSISVSSVTLVDALIGKYTVGLVSSIYTTDPMTGLVDLATSFDSNKDRIHPVSYYDLTTAANERKSSFKIINNYFGLNRGHAMQVDARNGIIARNTCETAENRALQIGNQLSGWGTGIFPSDLKIEQNTFRNLVNYSADTVIAIFDGFGVQKNQFKDIVVSANTFINPRKVAIWASGLHGESKIENNTVTIAEGRREPRFATPHFDSSIFIDRCDKVTVSSHTINDQNLPNPKAVVKLGGNNTVSGVTVTESGIVAIPSSIPKVQ